MTRYVSGLFVAGLGLCGGGWLIVAALVSGVSGGDASRVNLATGAGLAGVSAVSAAAWAVAWRRRLRADGVLSSVLPPVSRREARRNRRQLARDVRETARLAKWAARESRRGRPAADGPGPSGYRADEHAATWFRPAAGAGASGCGASAYGGAGNDGASAADVLDELRTLLGPLLSAAGPGPAAAPHPAPLPQPLPRRQPQPRHQPRRAPLWPPPPWPGQQPRPGQRSQAANEPASETPADDDGALPLADSEEAWW